MAEALKLACQNYPGPISEPNLRRVLSVLDHQPIQKKIPSFQPPWAWEINPRLKALLDIKLADCMPSQQIDDHVSIYFHGFSRKELRYLLVKSLNDQERCISGIVRVFLAFGYLLGVNHRDTEYVLKLLLDVIWHNSESYRSNLGLSTAEDLKRQILMDWPDSKWRLDKYNTHTKYSANHWFRQYFREKNFDECEVLALRWLSRDEARPTTTPGEDQTLDLDPHNVTSEPRLCLADVHAMMRNFNEALHNYIIVRQQNPPTQTQFDCTWYFLYADVQIKVLKIASFYASPKKEMLPPGIFTEALSALKNLGLTIKAFDHLRRNSKKNTHLRPYAFQMEFVQVWWNIFKIVLLKIEGARLDTPGEVKFLLQQTMLHPVTKYLAFLGIREALRLEEDFHLIIRLYDLCFKYLEPEEIPNLSFENELREAYFDRMLLENYFPHSNACEFFLRDIGGERQKDLAEAQARLELFVHKYNLTKPANYCTLTRRAFRQVAADIKEKGIKFHFTVAGSAKLGVVEIRSNHEKVFTHWERYEEESFDDLFRRYFRPDDVLAEEREDKGADQAADDAEATEAESQEED